MSLDTPIETLANCLYRAALVDLPEIPEKISLFGGKERVYPARRPMAYELTVSAMFPETWSDTSLGFGGMAGRAITPAYTVDLRKKL